MMMYIVSCYCVCVFISHMQLVYKLIGSLMIAMVYSIILVIVMYGAPQWTKIERLNRKHIRRCASRIA